MAGNWHKLDARAYHERALCHIYDDIAKARRAADSPSGWAAVASLRRQALLARQALDELEQVREDDPAEVSPEVWAEMTKAEAAARSDDDLDLFMLEWCARRRLLLVLDGDDLRFVRRADQ